MKIMEVFLKDHTELYIIFNKMISPPKTHWNLGLVTCKGNENITNVDLFQIVRNFLPCHAFDRWHRFVQINIIPGFRKEHKPDISVIFWTNLASRGLKKIKLPLVGLELTTLTITGLQVWCWSNCAKQAYVDSFRFSDPYKVILYGI